MQDDGVRHPKLPPDSTATHCSHHFATRIHRHAVGTYHRTVVYRAASMHGELPLDAQVRLHVEADISGVPVKGASQPVRTLVPDAARGTTQERRIDDGQCGGGGISHPSAG